MNRRQRKTKEKQRRHRSNKRYAITSLIAAAPEALDVLTEIASKQWEKP